MNHQRLQSQRETLAGKIVIGIDPAKDKHQAAVVDAHGNDAHGNQRGKPPLRAAATTDSLLWRRAMERALYIWPIFELPAPIQSASAGLPFVRRSAAP